MKTSMDNITLNMATTTLLDTGHLTALVRIPAAHMALATAYIILKFVKLLASDDFTLYMWKPESEKKPDQRLTGHQATINDVKFSPDARYIGSG